MNSTLAKIILGNVFRAVLTAVFTFLVTKNVIEADVASKLARGDTVQLWSGALSINLAMVVNVLVGLCLPILLPISLGIWSRMTQAYETIVARSQAFAVTKQELKDQVKDASVGEIIKAVATDNPSPST